MKILIALIIAFQLITFSQTKEELRAVWITNVDSDILNSDRTIASAMNYLADIGINVVFPVVWNKGYTIYQSEIMQNIFNAPIIPNFSGRDPLNRLIIEAHRNGIEVIPWFEFGFSPSYSLNGGHIIAKFPHWKAINNQGNLVVKNGFDWMAGTNPEVQDFLISLITEVLDKYEVDGVQGDDRLPAMPIEGGYDSVTVAQYKVEHNGNNPPHDPYNYNWKVWRAGKLNDFFWRLRDSVKTRSPHYIVSSAPSVYPWGLDNYLQDSRTWVDSGIVDNFIPQLYRTSIGLYTNELKNSLSFVPASKRNIFFAGVLVKAGSYVIDPIFLTQTMDTTRKYNVKGETFFFYEALRVNNDQLGNMIKQQFYSEPALVPYRNGNNWRPKGVIVNEDDTDAVRVGNWQQIAVPGFSPNAYWTNDTNYASITYSFDIPATGYYRLYAYLVPNLVFSQNAHYTLYSANDSSLILVDQKENSNNGWTLLGNVYLNEGKQTVLKLDNINMTPGKYIFADAVMLLINRKLSPDVIITSLKNEESENTFNSVLTDYQLIQNYPNPFNPTTKIKFSIPDNGNIHLTRLSIYDILGKEVALLINSEKSPGTYEVDFDSQKYGLSSGIYFCKLSVNGSSFINKMMLMK
ncbi:MAG: family 10 glycosylhydrolase [Ignavibacteria bacterium]|nr:family 10 glycosylhydrolase [Ignavibacteria bacterium]